MGADVSKESVPGQTQMLKALQSGASPIFIQSRRMKKGKPQLLTYKGHIPVYAPTLEELSIKYLNTVVPKTVPQATLPQANPAEAPPTQANPAEANPAEAPAPQEPAPQEPAAQEPATEAPASQANTGQSNKPRNLSRREKLAKVFSGFSNPFSRVGAKGTSSGAVASGIGSITSRASNRLKSTHSQIHEKLQAAEGNTPIARRERLAKAARAAGQTTYSLGTAGASAVGSAVGTAGSAIGTGLGAIGTGLGKAGSAVGNGLGAAGSAAGRGAKAVGVAGVIGAKAAAGSVYSGAKTLKNGISSVWSRMRGTRKNTRSVNQNSNQSSLIAVANQTNTGYNTGTLGELNASVPNTVKPVPTGLSSDARRILNSANQANNNNARLGAERRARRTEAAKMAQGEANWGVTF